MRLIRKILAKPGWHLNEPQLPIQFGIKHGDSPVGGAHLHKTMAEYFLVLEGRIMVLVSGEQVSLEKGDLLVVEPGEHHEMRWVSPDANYLLLMPRQVENDKVELPRE